MSDHPAGWHPDPLGRHEHRYWDADRWTDRVADQGAIKKDPFDAAEAIAAPVGPSMVNPPAITQTRPAEPAATEPTANPPRHEHQPAATAQGRSPAESFQSASTPLKLLTAGGALLLIALFLPWYKIEVGGIGAASANAFQSFSLLDLLMLVTAVTALAIGVLSILGNPLLHRIPAQLRAALPGLAGLCLLWALFRLVNAPFDSGDVTDVSFDLSRGVGFFLGLGGLGLILAGALKTMKETKN